MSEPQLNRKMIEMLKLLNIYLNHFPKQEKYALANQIRKTAYEVYDFITEGQKRYFKKTSLTHLDIAHEKLRMQIYLAHELGYFAFKDGRPGKQKMADHRHETLSLLVSEIGRMIGGWIRKIKEENQWK
jgi:four helix bundle protein